MALLHERDRDKIRIAESLSDLRNLGRSCVCSGELAVRGVLQERGNQEIAALHALAILAGEQPLAAREPPASGCDLPEKEKVMADPPRASGRARGVAYVAKCVLGALERGAVLVVEAAHVRRVRQQLEVCWLERMLRST